MSLNWADIFILAVLGVSALISLFRGFVREVLSLVVWVAALWLARTFMARGAELLAPHVSVPSVRLGVAFLVILVGVLIVGGLVNYLIGLVIDKTGLGATDRMFGVVFGVLRGAAIITILVLLAGLTPVPRDPWWKQSMLLGHFVSAARMALGYLPPDVAKHFGY